MKKFFKIFIINILCLILVFFILEIICFFLTYKQNIKNIESYNKLAGNKVTKITLKEHIKNLYELAVLHIKPVRYFSTSEFRKPAGLQYESESPDKSAIIIIGCSFPYGYTLKNEETFHYKLSEYTKRSVYNLSLIGGSPREILYMLRNENFLNSGLLKNRKAQYFIYINIPSHRNRLYANFRQFVPTFKPVNNNTRLKYYRNFFNDRSFLYYQAMFFYTNHLMNEKKAFNDLKLYIKEINRAIQNKFDNYNSPSKLVILVYGDFSNDDWNELNDENIIVIKINDMLGFDIMDTKYTIGDNMHPNAKAWEVIVPALAKELNL